MVEELGDNIWDVGARVDRVRMSSGRNGLGIPV